MPNFSTFELEYFLGQGQRKRRKRTCASIRPDRGIGSARHSTRDTARRNARTAGAFSKRRHASASSDVIGLPASGR